MRPWQLQAEDAKWMVVTEVRTRLPIRLRWVLATATWKHPLGVTPDNDGAYDDFAYVEGYGDQQHKQLVYGSGVRGWWRGWVAVIEEERWHSGIAEQWHG